MTRLGTTAVTFLLLGATDAAVTLRLDARHGRHVTRWWWQTAWSEATGDPTWHLWTAHGAAGATRLVVHGSKSIAVWTTDGQRLANGMIPWGTDVAVADYTGDAEEEIAFAAESLPPNAPVSIQVADQALAEVTPNIGLLVSLENPSSVAIVPFAGPRQVVAADFRGCLASLVPPDLVWEYCFPNAKVGGDPYAVRHLVPVAAGGGLLLAGRATGEVDALDAAGKLVWSFRLAEPLRTLSAARLDGDQDVAFAGGDNGRFAMLDAATGRVQGSGTLPGMVMVARPATWAGQRALAVAGLAQPPLDHRSGFVGVLDARGRKLTVLPVEGQVMDLAPADLDTDGSDELVVVTGAHRLFVLRPAGKILLEEAVRAPSETKLAVVRDAAGPSLVVADDQRLEVRRMMHVDGPWWYAARPVGAAVGLVLFLALAVLATLRPPAPE
jgi:putative pyrroloquinoline-quinone binding quinoprotein